MAVWQFSFSLVPEAGIHRIHGELVEVLDDYCVRDPDAPLKELSDFQNYWEGIEVAPSVMGAFENLLPERVSWSADARMFGAEDGNAVEVWDDDINCSVDLRYFDPDFLMGLLEIAKKAEYKVVLHEGGGVFNPVFRDIFEEIKKSRANSFVDDPLGYLKKIT